VVIGDGCWLWQGATQRDGYGLFRVDGRRRVAHRIALELYTGVPIPVDKFVCHHCDNPPCVRPSHLFIGTAADNVADMVAKGRLVTRSIRTHCIRGHVFDEANTAFRPRKHTMKRQCRACQRLADNTPKRRAASRQRRYEKRTALNWGSLYAERK